MTVASAANVAASISNLATSAQAIPAVTAAASVPQPFLIAVSAMPPGGSLLYIQVIGTLIIALCAAFVTWRIQTRQVAIAQQAAQTAHQAAETARNKLKLDLFDRRWTMYASAQKLIKKVAAGHAVDADTLDAYSSATTGAKWIFNKGTQDYFEALAAQVDALNLVRAERSGHASDDDSGPRAEWEAKLNSWWAKQGREIDDVMAPFMHLREGHVPELERGKQMFTPPPA